MREREYNLYDVIERNARLFPHREALIFRGSRLTFTEFKDRCDRIARALSRRGVVKGDRLAVVAQSSDDYLVLYGAAAKVGAVTVAVSWRLQAEELEYILADCSPKLVFADGEYCGLVSEAVRGIASVEGMYILGEGKAEGSFQRFDALSVSGGTEHRDDVPADAGFVIMYTAAVEGRPRAPSSPSPMSWRSASSLSISFPLARKTDTCASFPSSTSAAFPWPWRSCTQGGRTSSSTASTLF